MGCAFVTSVATCCRFGTSLNARWYKRIQWTASTLGPMTVSKGIVWCGTPLAVGVRASEGAPSTRRYHMRSVRCDVCGTKALMAASQCPKCAHLFELRDGFGELLPLSYCDSCDSHYPASLGSCKWCGTKPAPPPKI